MGDIKKVGIANGGLPVPLEHGVNSLVKFLRALLINTAGINPSILEMVLLSLATASL